MQMRSVAKGILTALAFMHDQSVVHCDMKPENVLLVPDSPNEVKIIDFGSSCLVGHQRYEYIQSRFYRAPEVILGQSYGPPMDIWSFGCVLAEMMIGHPIFPGDDEQEQMEMFMEVFGIPPRGVIEKSPRKKHFFGVDLRPIATTTLRTSRKRRRPGTTSLRMLTKLTDNLLLDLLGKCFEWDQNKRITAQDALAHPWFSVREVTTPRGTQKRPTLWWR
jgi:dual specificity tyrosine-phosphorylation-regulated kinase 2/3/4